jgi:hypothetical protein
MDNPSKEDYGELQKVKILEFARFLHFTEEKVNILLSYGCANWWIYL